MILLTRCSEMIFNPMRHTDIIVLLMHIYMYCIYDTWTLLTIQIGHYPPLLIDAVIFLGL